MLVYAYNKLPILIGNCLRKLGLKRIDGWLNPTIPLSDLRGQAFSDSAEHPIAFLAKVFVFFLEVAGHHHADANPCILSDTIVRVLPALGGSCKLVLRKTWT